MFGSGQGDMFFYRDPRDGTLAAPGDSQALLKLWKLHHNGRFAGGANRSHAFPFGRDDRAVDPDSLTSIDPADPNFLRPVADSALAKEGAGVEDPSLPQYVGAIPPSGIEPWDWDRTWRARFTRLELNKNIAADKK